MVQVAMQPRVHPSPHFQDLVRIKMKTVLPNPLGWGQEFQVPGKQVAEGGVEIPQDPAPTKEGLPGEGLPLKSLDLFR